MVVGITTAMATSLVLLPTAAQYRLALSAMSSFRFMLSPVPEPVWNTSTRTLGSCFPSITSSTRPGAYRGGDLGVEHAQGGVRLRGLALYQGDRPDDLAGGSASRSP